MKPRYLGISIVIVSLVVLGGLFYLNSSLNKQNFENCITSCEMQENTSCSVESCNLERGHNDFEEFISILEILVAFLAGIGFYLSLTKKEKIIEQKEYDLSKLNKEEKRVFLLVKKNKEKGIYQSNIVKEFDFSKSKVTRILDRLEQSKLVERKRRGMTNLIVLK